jgi:ABC-2 type transport system permease protein
MPENSVEPVVPAPGPSALPGEQPPAVGDAGDGPMLTCGACRREVLSGLVRCPSCGGSTRPLTVVLLAVVAGLGSLAALALYGKHLVAEPAASLRNTFFFVTSLGTLVAALSLVRGRRAGWWGLQLMWLAQLLVPLVYAMLLHRNVVETLTGGRLNLAAVKLPMALGLLLVYLGPTRAYCAAPSNLITILRRELGAFLYSPLAYVIMTFFLVFMGYMFYMYISFAGMAQLDASLDAVLGNVLTLLIFCAPLLTMRLMAEERKSGTIEILMTAPVSDTEIVLGKFLATLIFFAILIAPTLVYVVMLATFSFAAPDYGAIAGGYFGIFLVSAMYFALGLFVSSLTRNQISAAIVTFVLFVLIWLAGYGAERMPSGFWRDLLMYMQVMKYYESFGKGIVDTRAVIYFASLTLFPLFLTVRSLESRRWA